MRNTTGHNQPKVIVSDATFSWSTCKKSQISLDLFHIYCWSNNSAIPLNKKHNWPHANKSGTFRKEKHAKKLRYQLIISRDTDDKRILESDWTIDTTGPTYAKAVVSDATFSWWLSPCNKSKMWIDSFQRYWWSDHHAIWLVESILAHNWRLQIYPRHAAFAKALRTWLCIIFG